MTFVYWCKVCSQGWYEKPEHEHATEITGWMDANDHVMDSEKPKD